MEAANAELGAELFRIGPSQIVQAGSGLYSNGVYQAGNTLPLQYTGITHQH